ncbi:MAG: reactive intermediate/imine deaminase [Phycisphaeraceae bacterium]|nr:reactive intermediate/imine deaminase [Phycisphaeraceae bacterium]
MFNVITGDNAPDSPESIPTSQAIRAGDFVFLSAQCSSDDSGQIITGSFDAEMRRAFANVEMILSSAGLDLSDVVQVRCYLARRDDLAEFNCIYQEIFQKPFPVRTTLAGCLPCEGHIAVAVVAYAGRSS